MIGRKRKWLHRWYESCKLGSDNIYSNGIASPFVPLVKMMCHPTRNIRIIWGIFCIIMIIAIVCTFTMVLTKYLNHVTVFRLDQIGLAEGVQPPSITVCLDELRTTRNIHAKVNNNKLEILKGIDMPCKKSDEAQWSSATDSISPYFRMGVHFNVTFGTSPPATLAIAVTEQVPSPPDDMCTTFKLNHSCLNEKKFWKMLRIKLTLLDPTLALSRSPKVIIHEADGFPLDNYGRYLYEYVNPASQLYIFYSKSLQISLSTRNRPCSSTPITVLGHQYNYDQVACQWQKTCEYLNTESQCFCPLQMLKGMSLSRNSSSSSISLSSSSHVCEQQLMLMNTSVCPYSCETTTFKKFNEVEIRNRTSVGGVELVLIQDDAIEQHTEEELFGLAKLFSEIGGLSSFFFGFSCLILFDLLETCIRVSVCWCIRFAKSQRKKKKKQTRMKLTTSSQLNGASGWSENRDYTSYHHCIPYTPHCLPLSEESPIFQHRTKPGFNDATLETDTIKQLTPEYCSVLMDIDGFVATIAIK